MKSPLQRLVVLGTGFGAFNLVKHLKSGYDITVVSPRNHFLFTPLLPSTTVGTIEFRSIIEPIRYARKDLRFYWAKAMELDTARKIVRCASVADRRPFEVDYDHLVIAVGAVTSSFNVPGVTEYALNLKELNEARVLRQHIIRCFEQANIPTVGPEEKSRLLHFIVCGGGPTGVEFAAELNDFLTEDLTRAYPHLVPLARITIVEASRAILHSFDRKLREYTADLFRRARITVLTSVPVTRVDASTVTLADGSSLSYGLLLWSAGNGPTEFIRGLSLPKDNRELLLVDSFLRVVGQADLYALGDCATVQTLRLPATAQVAQQEGRYLARQLNARAINEPTKPFEYRSLGMLAYIGNNRALADLEAYKGKGWATWLFWRSAYITRIISLKNKVLVLFDWFKALVFGRDVSQF
ncbi:MAG: FAD-dependent oxidoreductase [Bacteroidota bacterium]